MMKEHLAGAVARDQRDLRGPETDQGPHEDERLDPGRQLPDDDRALPDAAVGQSRRHDLGPVPILGKRHLLPAFVQGQKGVRGGLAPGYQEFPEPPSGLGRHR